MMQPKKPSGFVVKGVWDGNKPYERCNRVNEFGNCGWFKERKDEATDTK